MVLHQSLQHKIPLEKQPQPDRTAPLDRGINIYFLILTYTCTVFHSQNIHSKMFKYFSQEGVNDSTSKISEFRHDIFMPFHTY